jgi:MFS family permease
VSYQGNIPRYYLFAGLGNFLLWMPVWVIFMQERGLSLGQIGVLELISILLLAISEVPTGAVADTFGRKWSMAIGASIHGFALLGILTSVLSPVFVVAYCLWAVSFSFLSGASEAFAYDSLKADHATGLYQHVASRRALISGAALGIAGPISGLLAATDLRLCFIGTAIAVFLAAAVISTGREPPTAEVSSEHRRSYLGALTIGTRFALDVPRVRYLILTGALLRAFTVMLLLTAIQQYADETGLPVWALGSIFLGNQVCSIAGSWLAPKVAARYGQDSVVRIIPLTIAGVMVMLWLASSPWAVILFGVAATATAIAEPVLSTLLNDVIPSRQRATIISLQSLVGTAGMAVAQFSVFVLADRTSMALALGAMGGVMAVLAAPLLGALARARTDASDLAGEGITTS